MKRLILAGAILLAASATPMQAQPVSATIISADRLRSIGDSLAPAASRAAQLGVGSGYTYAVTHRDSTGGIEAHMKFTDMFVIESGSGSLLSGGVYEGAKETSPGEWRGGSARDSTTRPLHVGDVVVIPAGMPHQVILGASERISYLAFKIAVAP